MQHPELRELSCLEALVHTAFTWREPSTPSKLTDIQGAAAKLGDVGSVSKPPPALHTSGEVIRPPGSLGVRNMAPNPTLPLHPSSAADWL